MWGGDTGLERFLSTWLSADAITWNSNKEREVLEERSV